MEISHILAAGGIVVRHDPEPRIGVVQLRKNKAWVLPKGKLNGKETALAAARREVLEETGHEVSIHEFVGALSYKSRGRPKLVQFWRMQVVDGPARKLMRDVRSVEWLPLDQAVKRLTRAHERIFLENVGPVVLRAAAAPARMRAIPAARKKPRARNVPIGNESARATPSRAPAALPEAPVETPPRAAAVAAAPHPWRRVLARLLQRAPLRSQS